MESMHSTSRLARQVPFYYGWVVVGAVGLTVGLSTAVAGAVFSIFIEPWSDEFGWSRTAIVEGGSGVHRVPFFVDQVALQQVEVLGEVRLDSR